jgi:hypothetical protein
MSRSARASSVLAVLLAPLALALAACDSDKCYRMGYERAGTSREQGKIDLEEAMDVAKKAVPSAPPSASAEAANAVNRKRVDITSAEMERRGYTPVKIPVDCKTGAPLEPDR